MLLKGLILSIASRNVCNTGAVGGVCFKKRKALEGLLKIGLQLAKYLNAKSSAPGGVTHGDCV